MSTLDDVGDVLPIPPELKISVSFRVALSERGDRTTEPGVILGSSSIDFI